jgi:putative transposase
MARPLRIEFPGALYHLTSRGNNKGSIFQNDGDRRIFLKTLARVVKKYNWICHGYCLMDNHYHLLIETPESNLCRGMRQLNGVYSQAYNRHHGRVGHLLQGRYKSILVEKESYLMALCRYIDLNPVKAGMVESPQHWPWSSYRATIGIVKAPEFLFLSWVLSQFSRHKDIAQQLYRDFVLDAQQCRPLWDDLRGGVLLGGEAFVAQMEPYLVEKVNVREIPWCERKANRPALTDLLPESGAKEDRSSLVHQAHIKWGYTLKDIGDVLGLHYSTVSRMVRREEKWLPQSKT